MRPPAETDHRWRTLHQGCADFYGVDALLIADDEDHVVGLTHFRPFARPLQASLGAFLDDLVVEEAERGGGAADAFLAEIRRLAEVNG